MNRKTVIFLLVVVLGLVLDQATKIWVYQNIAYRVGEIEVIPGFFSIVHAQNPGAMGGFMGDFAYRHWFFLGFTIIAVGVILDMFRKLPAGDRFLSLTLGLIMSGAIGNAIDRVHKQSVTDFLRFYSDDPGTSAFLRKLPPFFSSEWPSFNVADSLLVVGVGLFLVHYLFLEKPEDGGAEQPGDAGKPSATDTPDANEDRAQGA